MSEHGQGQSVLCPNRDRDMSLVSEHGQGQRDFFSFVRGQTKAYIYILSVRVRTHPVTGWDKGLKARPCTQH